MGQGTIRVQVYHLEAYLFRAYCRQLEVLYKALYCIRPMRDRVSFVPMRASFWLPIFVFHVEAQQVYGTRSETGRKVKCAIT